MEMNNKPNAVLFKRDDGQLCAAMLENNKWNWEEIRLLNMQEMEDKYDDISAVNPFEFVFCTWRDNKIITCNQKTVMDNYSFSKLYDENKLIPTIENDYAKQFGLSDII